MRFNKSSNPSLGSRVFNRAAQSRTNDYTMSIAGTTNKAFVLLLTIIVSASFTWKLFFAGSDAYTGLMYGGLIMGLIFALVTIFKPSWSSVTAPLYAIAEGLFLGGISAVLEASIGGIVMQAVMLTFGVFLVMLVLYRFEIIRATEKFKMGVVAATGGIAVLYLISMVMGMFGLQIPFLHEGGMIGIGISVVIVAVAALNLILDFDTIEEGVEMGAPKYMEWYGAFGLMVTLVWLYLEMLRLLSKLSRD